MRAITIVVEMPLNVCSTASGAPGTLPPMWKFTFDRDDEDRLRHVASSPAADIVGEYRWSVSSIDATPYDVVHVARKMLADACKLADRRPVCDPLLVTFAYDDGVDR